MLHKHVEGRRRTWRWLIGLALLASTLVRPLDAQRKPFSLNEILGLLRGGVSSGRVITVLGSTCIDFEVTPEVRSRLSRAGASDPLVQDLLRRCRAGGAAGPAAAPTPPARRSASDPIRTATDGQFNVRVMGCRREAAMIRCNLVIANNGPDASVYLDSDTRLYDELSFEYSPQNIRFPNGERRATIVSGSMAPVVVAFAGVSPEATQIKLLRIDGSIRAYFRDVPLQTENGTPIPPRAPAHLSRQPVQTTASGQLGVRLIECARNYDAVRCRLVIVNNGEDTRVYLDSDSRLFDELAFEYRPQEIRFPNDERQVHLVAGGSAPVDVVFGNVAAEATAIKLLRIDGSLRADFRNVPLRAQDGRLVAAKTAPSAALRPAMSVVAGQLRVHLIGCAREYDAVRCHFTIINGGDDTSVYVDTDSRLHLPGGESIRPSYMKFPNGERRLTLIRGVGAPVEITFGNVPTGATRAALLHLDGSFRADFRDVPIANR